MKGKSLEAPKELEGWLRTDVRGAPYKPTTTALRLAPPQCSDDNVECNYSRGQLSLVTMLSLLNAETCFP
jgi:hypothetical protein